MFEHMEMLGKQKIKGSLFTLSIRKNAPTVIVTDEEAVPERYKIPQPYKLDKITMLKDLKKNLKINGAEIKRTVSLSIR